MAGGGGLMAGGRADSVASRWCVSLFQCRQAFECFARAKYRDLGMIEFKMT